MALAACAPWHIPPGPATQRPILAKDRIVASDGSVLPLRRWGPAEKPRAVLLALHGFNDYSNAFAKPGARLAKAGILTYAYDQRGFGASANKGAWSSLAGMTGDLRQAARLIRRRHPDTPFYILGDSMGGAVVMAAFGESAPPPAADGYILASPAIWGRSVMPAWQRVALDFFAHTIPLFTITGQGFNRVPSDNIEMLRRLGRDPLVIKYTRVDAIYGLVELMEAALQATPRLPPRTLILLGKKEDILPKEAMAAFKAGLPGCVRVARYAGGHHMLLRDLGAETVLADLAAWLEAPDKALPSGAESAGKDSGAGKRIALDCRPSKTARP